MWNINNQALKNVTKISKSNYIIIHYSQQKHKDGLFSIGINNKAAQMLVLNVFVLRPLFTHLLWSTKSY